MTGNNFVPYANVESESLLKITVHRGKKIITENNCPCCLMLMLNRVLGPERGKKMITVHRLEGLNKFFCLYMMLSGNY